MKPLFIISLISVLYAMTSPLAAAPFIDQSANQVENGSFESGTTSLVSGHAMNSATNNWNQWTNSQTGISSQLITESEMQSSYSQDLMDGDYAIRVTANGMGDGLYSHITYHSPNWNQTTDITISAWVYVVSGEMYIAMGSNQDGYSYVQNTTVGQWEYLTVTSNAGQLNNQMLLYSINGPAEFIVDSFWLNEGTSSTTPLTPSAVPEPNSSLLLLMGFTSLIAARKRFQKVI